MKIEFTLVGGGSWVITIDGKVNIGCDPALAPLGTKYIYKGLRTKRVTAPVYNEETFKNTNLWIISHGHFDHIDRYGIEVIPSGATVISHKNCRKILKKRSDINTVYVSWGEKTEKIIDGYKIIVTAVMASHGINGFARFLMEGVNGYIITVERGKDKKEIYATSDTVYQKEIVEFLRGRKIDLMIANQGNIKPNMPGGPFTRACNKFCVNRKEESPF